MAENTELSSDYGSKKLKPGQKMADGTYFGCRSKTFKANLFILPFKGPVNWHDALYNQQVMKETLGYKGSACFTETELNKSAKNKKYDGGWSLATRAEGKQLLENISDITVLGTKEYWLACQASKGLGAYYIDTECGEINAIQNNTVLNALFVRRHIL